MNWLKKHLYLVPVLLYFPALFNFFSGDDWFHLRISQINNFSQFINFFSFDQTAMSAAFYRPLSTQVFFFVFQKIFGLTAWPYYLFVLICFAYSLYLIFRFALIHLKNGQKAVLTAVMYGVSVSNFTHLYFLSAFQEISLVIFSVLCLLSFNKSKLRSHVFFILALLSKETAIVLPILIFILNLKDIKQKLSKFIPFIVSSAIYLYLRLFIFGLVQGDSYLWNFSPIKALNTLSWYGLWSLGAPELLVDYIGSGFRPIARFFSDFPIWWPIIISLLGSNIILSVLIFAKNIKKLNLSFLKYLLVFLIPLLPVVFLPQHKFSLELGLSLIGFSLMIVYLLPEKKTIISSIFIILYFSLNIAMNILTYPRHYSVGRGEISRSVFTYLNNNFPTPPSDSYFEFINDMASVGSEWGQSKQISQALSGSDFFKVYYKNSRYKVYYQDVAEERPADIKPIVLSSKIFTK